MRWKTIIWPFRQARARTLCAAFPPVRGLIRPGSL